MKNYSKLHLIIKQIKKIETRKTTEEMDGRYWKGIEGYRLKGGMGS